MRRSLSLFPPALALGVSLLGVSYRAQAQAECGDVTVQGQCDGAVLSYCSEGQLVALDCATEYFPADVSEGACVEIDAAYGFDCGLPTGSPCIFDSASGSVPTFCAAPDDGCMIDFSNDAGFVCTAGLAACTEPAPGAVYEPSCAGDALYLDCLPGAQPLAIDCGSVGGTCADAACIVGEGLGCDNDLFRCATGFACEGFDPATGDLGVCVAATAPAETCDGVTNFGECQGSDAVYCSDASDDPTAELYRLSCGALEVGDQTLAGTCGVLSGWGSWCVVPTGTDCAFSTSVGDPVIFACGDAQGLLGTSACSVNAGCVAGVGVCDPAVDVGTTCQGDFLASACNAWGQYYGVDCAAEGNGICDESGAAPVCRAGAGGYCRARSSFLCQDGFICSSQDESAGGTCVALMGPLDAGVPDADGGSTDIDAGSDVDAGAPDVDAGTPPPADAGTPPPADAGTPPPADAGTPPPADAGTPPPADAGTPPPADAGTPPPADAGTPPPADAGAPAPADAGTTTKSDAGTGDDLPEPATGCGCRSASSDGSGLALFALALLGWRRGRSRR